MAVAPSRAVLGYCQWGQQQQWQEGEHQPRGGGNYNDVFGAAVGALSSSVLLLRPQPHHHCRLEPPLLRRGALAVVSAAKSACKRIGASLMGLYQTKIPCPFYPGGRTLALTEDMLDVISNNHTQYIGCVNFLDMQRLAKLQMKLRVGGGIRHHKSV